MSAETPADTLHRSRTGWLMLAGLGVSYVIGGDFSAWNFGLAKGGWGGMMIAVGLSALIWIALMMTLAELSSILPTAGGGYSFADRAFGPLAGRLTGFAIMVEYGGAAAVVAIFIEAYFKSLTGIGGWPVILLAFVIPVVIHLRGAKEAIGTVFALTLIALAGIVLFGAAMAPSFNPAKLLDIKTAPGGSPLLPFGWLGVWAAMPFATAFFLAVEGIAMAAEEVMEPQRTLPRAMMAAVLVLFAMAVILLLAGPGGAGGAHLVDRNDPLPAALQVAGADPTIIMLVNVAALIGLGACMFSAIYAFSRQAFALARAGHLPAFLSRTNRRNVPANAIVFPGAFALTVAFCGAAESVFVAMVLAAMISYLFMTAAHIRLRQIEPALPRPYRTPGGSLVAGFAFLASAALLLACAFASPLWSAMTAGLLTCMAAPIRLIVRQAH
jgi:ethanolamine permease